MTTHSNPPTQPSWFDRLREFWRLPTAHYLALYGIFLVSLWLLGRNNSFVSGDVFMIDLIARDGARLDVQSWYFYGQAYFGNLYVLLYAPLYRLFGAGVGSLQAYEHLLYWLSGVVLLATLPRKTWLSTVVFGLGFFFLNRFYAYSFSHTYPFILLMLSLAYWLTYRGFGEYYREYQAVLVGVLSGWSFWHNPIYLPVLLVYGVSLLTTYRSCPRPAPRRYLLRQAVGLGGGLAFGLVPLLLGTWQTGGGNLEWFGTNQASGVVESIKYWLRDGLLYFAFGSEYASLTQMKEVLASNPTNFFMTMGVPLICVGLVLTAFGSLGRRWRQEGALLLWIVCVALLIFRKGVDGTQAPFTYGRYLFFLQGFGWLAVAKLLVAVQSASAATWTAVLARGGSLVAVLLALTTAGTQYTTAYKGTQIYESVYAALAPYDIKYLYCENFFNPCLGLVSQSDGDMTVQLLEDNAPYQSLSRNPHGFQRADAALDRGEVVYALTVKRPEVERTGVFEEFTISGAEYEFYLVENQGDLPVLGVNQ